MVDFRIDVVVDPRRARRGARVVERQLGRIENRADRVRVSLARMLGPLIAAAGVGASIRTLANFEQAIANVGAISEASTAQLVALREAAQELGATTRFTASQAAEGLTFLARAGFSVEEALATVDDTLRLAQVGMLDLGTSADIATNVLAGFGLGVDEAGRFVDVLAKTSTSANTDIRQLGDAMKLVAPVAAGVGVTLEETAAAIGTLSNAGLQATLAGTGLRRVLAELESPGAKTERILRELGLSANDVRVSAVGLDKAMSTLGERGLTAAQALEIFGQRGGPAAIVLTQAADATRELTTELENADGFARRTAIAMDDNLRGSLLRVKSAFEAVILAVGGAGATGGLRGLLDGLANALRGLAENADALVRVTRNLAIVLGPRVLLGAVRALTAALLRNPFTILLVGAAAVIALIPDLQAKFDALINTIGQVAAAITDSLDFSGMLVGIAAFADQGVAFLEGFGAAAGAVFDALGQQPGAAGQVMLKAIRDTVEAMVDFFAAAAQTIGNILIGIGSDTITIFENVGGSLGAISKGNLQAAKLFGENIESALTRTANRVATFQGQFQSNLRKLRDVDVLPDVELTNEARDLGKNVAAEFRRGMEESDLGARAAVELLLAPIADMEEVASDVGTRLAEALKKPLANVQATVPIVLTTEQQQLRSALDVAEQRNLLETDLNAILAQRPELVDEAARVLADFNLKALESSTALEDGFARAFANIAREAEDLAAVGEAIVNAFADNATDALVEFAETGQFKFREFASAILRDLTRIIARLLIVQALNAAFGGGAGTVTGAGAQLAGERQEGGTVQPARSFVVGENGPELFVPNRTGTIVPNQAEQPAPVVNTTIVNVDDPNMVPQAIDDGIADQAIINVLSRKSAQANRILGSN